MPRPKTAKPMMRISSSLTSESCRRLEEIADLEKGSVAQIIRRAVEFYIETYEDPRQARLPLVRPGRSSKQGSG